MSSPSARLNAGDLFVNLLVNEEVDIPRKVAITIKIIYIVAI